ncbi:unnamed protein product [[Candida] boidinii]|nr:unnamed protein product [[Candida] boidinii]
MPLDVVKEPALVLCVSEGAVITAGVIVKVSCVPEPLNPEEGNVSVATGFSSETGLISLETGAEDVMKSSSKSSSNSAVGTSSSSFSTA